MPKEKQTSKLSRLAVMGITLLVLIVPFCLYYFVYVSSQQDYFTNRSFRSLAGMGRQIVSRVEGLRSVVESAAARGCENDASGIGSELQTHFPLFPFGTLLELDDSSVQAEFFDTKSSSPKPQVTVKFKQDGSTILNYQCGGGSEFKKGRFSVTSYNRDELFTPVVARFVLDDSKAADEGLFDRVFVADSETGAVLFEYGLDSMTIVNLGDLLASQASSSSGSNNEKAQASQTAGGNPKPGQQGKGRGFERGSSEWIKIKIADAEYKLFVQPIQLGVSKVGSDPERGYELTVCGLVRSDHMTEKTFSFSYTLLLLFILLVLMTTLSGPLVKLRLIGPKDRLRKADVALTACSAFFGTALLTVTLLDGYTYVSLENELDYQLKSLAGSVDLHLRSELASASEQLDQLNQTFPDKLEGAGADSFCPSETPDATAEITSFREKILGGEHVLEPLDAPYPYFNTATWANLLGKQQIKFTTRGQHTAFVSVRDRDFFRDAIDGKLWDLTPIVDQNAQPAKPDAAGCPEATDPGMTVNQDRQQESGKFSLCLQALTSRTSGENVAVISKLTPDKKYVSFLDARLLSLYHPVLPTGYGFCVIDSDGRVLFHTDDVKNLDENFFEECNRDNELRSTVQSRQSEFVNLQYLGRAHRAFATPIKDLPWSLVVFRDRQILRTVNLEMITLAAIAFLIYALLLTIALVFIFVSRSKARFEIVWPNPKWLECYKQVTVVNSALFLICTVLVIVSSREELIVWALLFPALGLIHALLVMAKTSRLRRLERRLAARARAIWRKSYVKVTGRPRKKKQRAPGITNWQRTYTLALLSMLAVTSVAPAMAFFKLMRDEQIRVFITHGQMSLARGLERREDQVRGLYSSVHPPIDVGEARDEFIEKRLGSELDVYSCFFFKTDWRQDKKIGGRPLGGVLCWFLTNFSPFYNQTCVESLRLVRGLSSDKRWESEQRYEERSKVSLLMRAFTRQDDSRGAVAGAIAESSTPQSGVERQSEWMLTSVTPQFMNFAQPWLWLLAVSLTVMLVLAYFAVRFAARRILLLDMKAPGLTRRVDIPPGPAGENYLIVGPPAFNQRERFRIASPPGSNQAHDFVPIDMSDITTEEQWQKKTELAESSPDRKVVLNRFEFNRHDALWNERKLRFVEHLIQTDRRVVIISSVDPISFPLSVDKKEGSKSSTKQNSKQDKSGEGKEEPAPIESHADRTNDSERWSVALASFVRVIAFEAADPKAYPDLFAAVGAGENPWRYLERIAPRVPTANAGSEELIAEVGHQSENYYREVWSTCSREERMTLFRVAKDGLVSRLDPDLRRLIQKGFIVRDPALRLMDESFRRFVISTAAAEGVSTYRAEVDSRWETLKAPLLLILLGVIAFLFITQKELFDSTLSLVSALTGGGLAMLKLFGMFQRGKDSSAGQS